jgi:hypothetical protein
VAKCINQRQDHSALDTVLMEKQNIVGRAQTGKLMLISERQIHLETEIAHHLGMVGRDFQSGLIDK